MKAQNILSIPVIMRNSIKFDKLTGLFMRVVCSSKGVNNVIKTVMNSVNMFDIIVEEKRAPADAFIVKISQCVCFVRVHFGYTCSI